MLLPWTKNLGCKYSLLNMYTEKRKTEFFLFRTWFQIELHHYIFLNLKTKLQWFLKLTY